MVLKTDVHGEKIGKCSYELTIMNEVPMDRSYKLCESLDLKKKNYTAFTNSMYFPVLYKYLD